jgi:hypothetical protein
LISRTLHLQGLDNGGGIFASSHGDQTLNPRGDVLDRAIAPPDCISQDAGGRERVFFHGADIPDEHGDAVLDGEDDVLDVLPVPDGADAPDRECLPPRWMIFPPVFRLFEVTASMTFCRVMLYCESLSGEVMT